jgi:hypothetical protein
MTEYWFRPKRYGYGATPVTWQGWALTFAAPGLIVAAVAAMAALGATANAVYWIVLAAIAIAATAITVVVSYRRTDGEWRWRWGNGER